MDETKPFFQENKSKLKHSRSSSGSRAKDRLRTDPQRGSHGSIRSGRPSVDEHLCMTTVDRSGEVTVASFGDMLLEDNVPSRSSRLGSYSSFLSISAELVRNFTGYESTDIGKKSRTVSLPDIPSIDRRSSSLLVSINLQSMVLGTSLLGFPFAFLVAGVSAIPLTIIIGLMSSYTGVILVDCLYEMSKSMPGVRKRVRRSFVEICNAVWPCYGQYVMESVVYLTMARNTVVLVLLTDLTVEITKEHLPNIDEGVWTCAWALAVLPFLFIKRVSALAWVSFLGLLFYLTAILALVVTFIVSNNVWRPDFLKLDFDLAGAGLATGIILNSYGQHLSFPPLEGSMRTPRRYNVTIHTSFFLNILFKICFGLIGVLSFGPATAQSITGNLPKNTFIAAPIRVAIIFFTYFSIPMQSFVTFDLIDSKFLRYFPILQKFDGSGNWAWVLLSRSIVMSVCLLPAVLLPEFSLIVGLIGSVRGTVVCLVFPAIFYYSLHQQHLKLYEKIICIAVGISGVLCGIWGLYGSLYGLSRFRSAA